MCSQRSNLSRHRDMLPLRESETVYGSPTLHPTSATLIFLLSSGKQGAGGREKPPHHQPCKTPVCLQLFHIKPLLGVNHPGRLREKSLSER